MKTAVSSQRRHKEKYVKFKQKIGHMALGGLLVLGGHVVPSLIVQKATAQGNKQALA